METVVLDLQTVNGLLNYLGRRPYVEVAELISRVQADLERLNSQKRQDEDTDSKH